MRKLQVDGEYMYRHATDDWDKSGAVADRWEERKNGVVRGQYALLQPDGKIRTVDYVVNEPGKGKGGFKVVVRYWPGPQQLLSSMTLSEMMADHPQPQINNLALYGKFIILKTNTGKSEINTGHPCFFIQFYFGN